jgi:hypothetical protein
MCECDVCCMVTTIYLHSLDYTILHYTTLHYTTLHFTTLYYTALHYTTLHYTTLQCRELFTLMEHLNNPNMVVVDGALGYACEHVCVHIYVCVRKKEREYVCVCVHVCESIV